MNIQVNTQVRTYHAFIVEAMLNKAVPPNTRCAIVRMANLKIGIFD